jgi:hypothetical protein
MQKQQADVTAKGVVWISINSAADGKQGFFKDDAAANAYVKESGMKSTAYVRDTAGTFGKAFNAKVTPHMFVIDAAGTVVYQGAIDSIKSASVGDIEKAENYVTSALTALSDKKPVATGNTEAYGCGVKY